MIQQQWDESYQNMTNRIKLVGNKLYPYQYHQRYYKRVQTIQKCLQTKKYTLQMRKLKNQVVIVVSNQFYGASKLQVT